MTKVTKPVRRVASRPIRVLGWLTGIRPAPGAQQVDRRTIEVWQWTRPKYRLRAILLLLLNAILFAGLGSFALWLRTGQYMVSSFDEYWHTWSAAFDPTREHQLTLIDYLFHPIPVDQVPLMMVIIALVLASLTAIPILVSMLYGFWFAMIFIVMIAFVAMLPWLAVTVIICCLLTRWRRLQFSFHYATALVAILPLASYYALATRNAAVFQLLPPVEIAKLYVPWIMAILGACVLMGVGLFTAWLVNYRPGAIAPLLAVMFTIPVVLFEAGVGRNELYYRLLEASFGPASKTHFVDNMDALQAIRRLAAQNYDEAEELDVTQGAITEQILLQWQFLIQSAFTDQQSEVAEACDIFRGRFPDSRYIPNVLFIKGRALDMRIDEAFFNRQAILRYYHDFPSAASKSSWEELHDRFPQSPLWAFATLRLAMLEARDASMDRAMRLLDELISWQGGQDGSPTTNEAPSGWRSFIAKRPASSTLSVDPVGIIQEGRKLHHLLVNNRDPQQDDLPLRRLLHLVPRHPGYRERLKALRAEIPTKYPLTPLGDNLNVLIAATEPSRSLKIDQLRNCVEDLLDDPQSDALAQARCELGVAYKEDDRPQEARAAFEDVVRYHPDSPWAWEARRRLVAMGATARLEI